MKNYNLHDYKSIHALRHDIVVDMNEDFADLEITSNKYTDCEILEITRDTDFNGLPDVMVDVSCNAGIKGFCFRGAVNSGLLILPEDKLELFNNYFNQLDAATKLHKEEEAEQIRLANIKAEKEAELRRVRAAEIAASLAKQEAEEKFKAKIIKSQKNFESKIKTNVRVDKDPLDWLKENTVSVTATIPSHLENIFVGRFGDVPHKVIDSNKLTSGGNSMKWAAEFVLTVKKDVPIHPALTHLFKANKLHDTSFIAKLVYDGELSFGKNV